MLSFIKDEFRAHLNDTQRALENLSPIILDAGNAIIKALKNNKKVLICGNGGSAADSQHFAAELTGRYKRERKGLHAVALSTDTSAITAIANDYGYDFVFSRQVEALIEPGDVLIGISTSGNSQNVINALEVANKTNCVTISLSGKDGGAIKSLCDYSIIAPSNDTPRIQEIHIICIHILCDMVEQSFVA